jgi:hypothetical protein
LVPPYSHRRNSAERAIRSFKDHLIAWLCSTDKSFPMHLWDRLLPHAVITLNMPRTSRINPKLSAATHIFGQYDFNRAPMAPPGTRIIAHETPIRRRTWAIHGQDGWNIGPALEYYQCYTVYINKTRGNKIVETVEFFPKNSPYHLRHPKIWPLRPQRISRTPYCIRNRRARFVRSATNKQSL